METVRQDECRLPVIDSHIHLFDTTRPQGVPWPEEKDEILYRPALPDRYREIAIPLGITGAIVIEASPLLEDNQWILDIAARDSVIVGAIGNLEPGKPGFGNHLERLQKDPLFLGIRFGNVWDRDLGHAVSTPEVISDLKFLAAAGLTLDTVGPDCAFVSDVVRLTDKVPDLRVVIDHVPQIAPPAERSARQRYEAYLRELGGRPQVYAKISAVLSRVDGRVPLDLSFYQPALDELEGYFGEERLLYGSDWPNSDLWAPYDEALGLLRRYCAGKGSAFAEKLFWQNSIAAYRWKGR